MNKELTSVEWLWEQIDNAIPYQNIKTSQVFNGILEKAKELHRQQIIDAYKMGKYEHDKIVMSDTHYAEQYYNNKYGK
jgi:disulfide oxidoreductase YuzD